MPRMPAFIPPMLATLVAAPFDEPDWQFEVKWDGFRVEAVVDGDTVRLWTRGQQDAARYFGTFLEPPSWLSARQAIVDGEVIALDDRGEPDFALLQARIKGQGRTSTPTPFVYEVFDLMWLDGKSLLDEPLEDRRRILADALRADPRVRLSEHIAGDGIAFFEAARARSLEGIMAKDRRSRYEPGRRSMAWQKVKIRPEQELVVGGMTRGTGKAVELGALLVGFYEDGALRWEGRSRLQRRHPGGAPVEARTPRGRPSAVRRPATAAGLAVGDLAASRCRDPGRIRRLDGRGARSPGGLQGLRPR
jgi:bifunctional non-homologous end joining protein LigD